jgi:hypothetical protein
MDQCHAWDAWYDSISATCPKKLMIERCEGAIASTSSPLNIAFDPIDQVRFSGTVC